MIDYNTLCQNSKNAAQFAYSPYSSIKVGASLVTTDGTYFCGANIEISAHSPTICAERTAFSRAIFKGYRDFAAIAVYGEFSDGSAANFTPCGVCRQFMSEFCSDDFEILVVHDEGYTKYTLDELLPHRFGL